MIVQRPCDGSWLKNMYYGGGSERKLNTAHQTKLLCYQNALSLSPPLSVRQVCKDNNKLRRCYKLICYHRWFCSHLRSRKCDANSIFATRHRGGVGKLHCSHLDWLYIFFFLMFFFGLSIIIRKMLSRV